MTNYLTVNFALLGFWRVKAMHKNVAEIDTIITITIIKVLRNLKKLLDTVRQLYSA